MNWGSLLRGFLEWLESLVRKETAKPSTIEDAKTPQGIRSRWAAYIADRLRNKDRGDRQPK